MLLCGEICAFNKAKVKSSPVSTVGTFEVSGSSREASACMAFMYWAPTQLGQ